MNTQESFEKWWDNDTYIVNNGYEEDSPIYWAHIGWQASQADQAKTIAQLQLDNAKLREALEACKYDCQTGEVIGITKEALGET